MAVAASRRPNGLQESQRVMARRRCSPGAPTGLTTCVDGWGFRRLWLVESVGALQPAVRSGLCDFVRGEEPPRLRVMCRSSSCCARPWICAQYPLATSDGVRIPAMLALRRQCLGPLDRARTASCRLALYLLQVQHEVQQPVLGVEPILELEHVRCRSECVCPAPAAPSTGFAQLGCHAVLHAHDQ